MSPGNNLLRMCPFGQRGVSSLTQQYHGASGIGDVVLGRVNLHLGTLSAEIFSWWEARVNHPVPALPIRERVEA